MYQGKGRNLLINWIVLSFPDAESHILFFDIEGLIFELHSEEYAAMSPTTLEVSLKKVKLDVNLSRIYRKMRYKNDTLFSTMILQAQGLITSTGPAQHNDASKKISGEWTPIFARFIPTF